MYEIMSPNKFIVFISVGFGTPIGGCVTMVHSNTAFHKVPVAPLFNIWNVAIQLFSVPRMLYCEIFQSAVESV